MRAPDSKKKLFAALPLRAMGDRRLTGLDWAILACVSWHDRSAGRCWASHKTICAEVRCNYASLSRSLRKLTQLGYIERYTHPRNKKRRIYGVIADYSLPTCKLSAEIVCQPANYFSEYHQTKPLDPAGQNVNGHQPKRCSETINSEETPLSGATFASENRATQKYARCLAIIERRLKTGTCSKEEFEEGISFCNAIINTQPFKDPEVDWPTWYWANRLLGEYEPEEVS